MPESVKVQYKFSKREFILLSLHFFFRLAWMKFLYGIATIAVLARVIILFYPELASEGADNFGALLLFSLVLLSPAFIVFNANKVYNKAEHLKNSLEADFSSTGFKVSGKGLSIERDWSTVFSIKVSKKYVFIFLNKYSAESIKKDAFATESDIEQIKSWHASFKR